MIKGLIKKDLYNLSSYKSSLIIIIIFCGITIVGTDAVSYAPLIICAITGMIALSTFSYDEMAKSNKYILTLPTNKKEIIKSKFILAIGSTILGGILGALLTILLTNVMNYIRPNELINLDYGELLISTVAGMWGISLVQSIQIPSIYKWGAERGRIQMFVLIFILIVAIGGIGFLIMESGLDIDLKMIESFMNQFGIWLLIALMLIMYFVSYKISYRIYKNKEE